MPEIDTETKHKPARAQATTNGPVHATAPTRKPRKPIPENETKRQKFKRVVERRINALLLRMDSLITLGRNKQNYEYDNGDVERIIEAIREKTDTLENVIKIPVKTTENRFQI